MESIGHKQEDDDLALVALCSRGDTGAFEMLVSRHQKKMYNIAYRITGDESDAAEVVQDAFFSAYKAIKDFQQKSLFSTWLFTITVNTARNRLKQTRTRYARETASLDDPSPVDGTMKKFEPASDDASALELLLKKERNNGLQKCLNNLEQDFKEVIVLRDIQGFSYGEISSMLSIPEGTVKSRLSRARDSVKDCLKKVLNW